MGIWYDAIYHVWKNRYVCGGMEADCIILWLHILTCFSFPYSYQYSCLFHPDTVCNKEGLPILCTMLYRVYIIDMLYGLLYRYLTSYFNTISPYHHIKEDIHPHIYTSNTYVHPIWMLVYYRHGVPFHIACILVNGTVYILLECIHILTFYLFTIFIPKVMPTHCSLGNTCWSTNSMCYIVSSIYDNYMRRIGIMYFKF